MLGAKIGGPIGAYTRMVIAVPPAADNENGISSGKANPTHRRVMSNVTLLYRKRENKGSGYTDGFIRR